jgi:hypothetical protein
MQFLTFEAGEKADKVTAEDDMTEASFRERDMQDLNQLKLF